MDECCHGTRYRFNHGCKYCRAPLAYRFTASKGYKCWVPHSDNCPRPRPELTLNIVGHLNGYTPKRVIIDEGINLSPKTTSGDGGNQ